MRIFFIIFSLFVIISISANDSYSEDPSKQWAKVYSGNNMEYAYAVQETSDGGYILAGFTLSFGTGNRDVWVLKLDSEGNVSWQNTYGGTGSDYAYSVQVTLDGGYVVAGCTNSFGTSSYDIFVLRLNGDGTIFWQKTYGGSDIDIAYDLHQTSDGGYVVAGYTKSFSDGDKDICVLKLDSEGAVSWQTTYGGTQKDDEAWSVRETSDGGYIVAGNSYSCSQGEKDMIVLKLDNTGDVIWQKGYDGGENDYAFSIEQTIDGGYILCGHTSAFETNGGNIRVLKLAIDGTISWEKNIVGDYFERSYSIHQTTDGGYILAGDTYSFGAGGRDMWLIKLNNSGDIQWQKTFGGAGDDTAYSIQQTSGGGYVVTGKTSSFSETDTSTDIVVLRIAGDANFPVCGDALATSAATSSASSNDMAVESINISLPYLSSAPTTTDISITTQSSTAEIMEVCYFDPNDVDGDGIPNSNDNCPDYYNQSQVDIYPQGGNGIGDSCECEGDFECDGDCDGTDATLFKTDFGRSIFTNPCNNISQCNGDFDCDGDCDGTDATSFKVDFGRSSFNDPCPSCTAGDWCSYQ